jgi:hypothetical protein
MQDEHLADRLEEFVYGAITVLVVIGALDSKNLGSARAATLVVVGTAIATWLAHAYAAIIGVHLRERRAVQPSEILLKVRNSWRIVTAAVPAILILVVTEAADLALRGALTVATIVGVLELVAVAVIAARRSGFTVFGVVLDATMATIIGLIVVAIELAVVH